MDGVINLQNKYAEFVGAKYAVACNSGTSALHLALLAVGVQSGDEVILPDFTMAACGFAVSYIGAKPVFVDCKDDLQMDETKIEAKITPKTKAIMPVHIYGRLCNMDAIVKIAKKHKLKVVEDACEAQGAIFQSKADITCYSFYQNKIIRAEEGGICTTDNKKYAEKMEYLRCMAFDKNHTYFHKDIGFNYRMPNSQALMALISLGQYYENAIKRRNIEGWYNEELLTASRRDAVWVYDTRLPWKEEYAKIPGVRRFFKPLSSMPMWGGKCQSPKAKKMSKFCYLPVHPDMTREHVKDICSKL